MSQIMLWCIICLLIQGRGDSPVCNEVHMKAAMDLNWPLVDLLVFVAVKELKSHKQVAKVIHMGFIT